MKDNKLIAEFMGYSPVSGVYVSRKDEFHIDEMQYDISWDWLMPVVQECRLESRCKYDTDDNWDKIHWALEDCDIDKTYDAVVNFIRENTDTEKMMKMRIADMDSDLD